MENQEYIIINKTAIQERIENLRKYVGNRKPTSDEYTKMHVYQQVLSQSTPLIPEIEKAWVDGFSRPDQDYEEQKQDYISNLKLDI